MDKEIWIDDNKTARMYYVAKSSCLGIPYQKRILASITPIKPNRGETLTEIADKLEAIREAVRKKRKVLRRKWIAKYKSLTKN